MVSNNRIEMADQRSTARLSINELMKQAKLLESDGNLEDAVKNYHTVIAKDKLHTAAYNRLMIVYHRQKMYKKELSTIKKALAAYENDLLKDQRWVSGLKSAFGQSTGINAGGWPSKI